jgi:hypothetical protein
MQLRIALIGLVVFVLTTWMPSYFVKGAETRAPSTLRPHWIWASSDLASSTSELNEVSFVYDFETTQPARIAKLKIAADFCDVRVLIDEHCLLDLESHTQIAEMDVTEAISLGKHRLRLDVSNRCGPSAIALCLSYALGNATEPQMLVTDERWRCSAPRVASRNDDMAFASSLGVVSDELWDIQRRSIALDPTENYEQWRKATSGTSLNEDQF